MGWPPLNAPPKQPDIALNHLDQALGNRSQFPFGGPQRWCRVAVTATVQKPNLIELRNLVEVADLIIRSALSRHESRGLHYTLDYPEMAAEAVDTVLVP